MKILSARDVANQPLEHAEWVTADQPVSCQGLTFPAGSRYKTFATKNWGWIWFDHQTTNRPGQHGFKF